VARLPESRHLNDFKWRDLIKSRYNGIYKNFKEICMSKKTLDTDYEIILNTIALFPDGASIKSILSSLKIAIPLRTLQRWLAHLKETGKITMTGRGSASRYHIVATETQIPISEKTSDNAYQKIIPLSPVAEKIREEVTRPLNQRTYVGYKRTFLDSYLPNVTYYLPIDILPSLKEGDSCASQHKFLFHRQLPLD
jgi:hypothetical protein